MKKLFGSYKKIIAFALALLMTLSVVPFMALAAEDKVVVTTEYTSKEGEVVFSTVGAAVSYLGAAGGTIYVKGAISTGDAGLEGSNVTPHAPITIIGYGNTITNNSLGVSTQKSVLYGDFIFKHIKITYKPDGWNGFITGEHTFTFGEGSTVTNAAFDNNSSYVGNANIVLDSDAQVMSSGNLYAVTYWNNTNHKHSKNYVQKKGQLPTVLLGLRISGTTSAFINGDIKYTMDGGSINNLYIAAEGNATGTNPYGVKGNILFTMNGGSVNNLYFSSSYGSTGIRAHNVVFTLNNKTMDNSAVVKSYNTNMSRYSSTSKWIIIENNDELNMSSVDSTVVKKLDYHIKVNGGSAEAVFSEATDDDASTSTLLGFRITSDTEGLAPYIGENELVADKATGLYNIPAGTSVIEFAESQFEEEEPEIIVVTTEYTSKEGEIVFADIASAIAHLGEAGGTIYVNGAITAESLASASAAEHGKVIIEGYTGKEADSVTITAPTAKIYGDIEFRNIALATGSFGTTGKTIIIGENVDTANVTFGNHDVGPGDNFIINSGDNSAKNLHFLNSYVAANGTANKAVSANYVINGGKLGTVYMGNYNGSASATFNLKGDMKLWLKDGEITKLYLGARMQNNSYHNNLGHFSFRMSGGSIGTLYYGGAYKYNGRKDNYNTMALIFDNATITNNVTINRYDSKDTVGTVSLGVLVLNNYEVNKVTVPSEVLSDMKYKVYVTGGMAEPVFERTDAADASTSTLMGFNITSDEEGLVPYVNGEMLEKNKSTGLYNIPEGTAQITFDAAQEVVKNYDEFIKLRNPLTNTLEKLENNEDINVVYFGGSVTAGYGSTNSSKFSWRGLTGEYIETLANEMGSGSTINNINKALGESGTFMGAYRTPHDIITANPDLLFIEYAINDGYGGASYEQSMQRMETIVREVRFAHPDCDIVFVLTTDEGKILAARDGVLHANAQAHEDLAKAYGISTIQVGAALASLMPEGELTAEQVQDFWRGTDDSSSTDGYAIDWSHPNNNGYAMYFSVVKEFLNKEFAGENTNTAINIDVTNKNTVVSDNLFDGNRMIIYGDGSLLVANSATAPVNAGITFRDLLANSKGFTFSDTTVNVGNSSPYGGTLRLAKGTYGELTATFEGTELALYADFATNAKYKYSIDGGADVTVTAGSTGPYIVFEGIAPGTHTVTLKFDWNDGLSLYNADDEALNISLILLRDASKQTKGAVKVPVVGPAGTTVAAGEKLYTDIPAAIAALGAEGGTIYVKGEVATVAGLEDGTIKSHGLVKIVGYGNSAEGNVLTVTKPQNAIYGDITFENIKVLGNTFISGEHTITFGTGTAVSGNGLTNDGGPGGTTNLVINSANAAYTGTVYSYIKYNGPINLAYNQNVVFNKGSISNLLLGLRISNLISANGSYINGNLKFTMNGGTINWINIGAENNTSKDTSSNPFGVKGNIEFIMNGGKVSNLSFSASYAASGARAHNIVFTFNNATMDNTAKVIHYNDVLKRLNSNSKWIIIENNIENDKTTVDAKILAKLDYHVQVNGGKAEAVFSEATGGDASTSVLKGFRITSDTEGLVPFGNGKMLMADENGLYDLSVLYTRDVEITFAEAEAIYSDGETVTVLSDCEITASQLEHRYKEGYIFLGWKLNGAYTAATVSVKAGDKLTAEYAAYNAAEQFYVKGIQMRTTGAQGVRFILSKQNSLDSILIGAGLSIKEFGSLILPVELTHGKDMEYGKPIYKGGTTEILGTPLAVKADKLYAETESGVEYTVVVTDISAEKYYRFYAVQGYLVYTDANGNEQVVYSTYGQSSLYRAALHLAADEEAGESAKAQAQAVIDYVQNVRPESYKNYYLANVEKTDLGYNAVKGEKYTIANGLKIVDFTLDLFGGQGEAINIVNFSDTHLSYLNKRDFGEADPVIMSEYIHRTWNRNGGSAVPALRAMEFASFADKTILTGDTYDYYSYGGFQMAQRLLYNYNNEIGTYTDAKGITRNNTSVLVAIGNHEPFKRFEGTVQYTSDHEALADTLNAKWNNDIVYHSEDIVKGENAVKVVVLNNQSRKITREEILTNLAADIEAARNAGTKILVFQHVPFWYCGDTKTEGSLTYQVYELIKGNADVVKAVFAGDYHEYDYRETEGTNGTFIEATTGLTTNYSENSIFNIIIK